MALEKNNKPDNTFVSEASSAGISIQKRIDAMREARREFSSKTQNVSDDKTLSSDEEMRAVMARRDEAFLKKFEEELFKHRGIRRGETLEALTVVKKDASSRRNGGIEHASGKPEDAPSSPVSQDEVLKEGSSAPGGTPSKGVPARKGLPPKGAILLLGTGDVAIFHRDVPDKQYQVVLVLNPDGTVSPEGVCLLDAYDFERIGLIPIEHLDHLIHTLVWNRDHIIYHLDSFDYAHLIVRPRLGALAQPESRWSTRSAEWPAPGHSEKGVGPAAAGFGRSAVREKLERGQRFRIPFGKDRAWEAVYWCEDVQGSVVAHKTQGLWSLMHLDLARFKDTMQLLDKVNDAEATEIEKVLRHIWA